MNNFIRRFVREEEGQDLVEYAFLLVFIALALAAAVTASGTNIIDLFTTVNAQIGAS